MSNLVPEKRVNKNGIAVIKHVRAGGDAAPKSSLPAPALSGTVRSAKAAKPKKAPSATDIRDRMQQRESELYEGNGDNVDSYGYEKPYIDKFPPELRQRIYDFIAVADRIDHNAMIDLFSNHYSDKNRFDALITTIADIRAIDTCRSDATPRQSADNLGDIYQQLRLPDIKGDLSDYHFGVLKAEHLAASLKISEDSYTMPHEYYREIETFRTNFDALSPVLPVVFAAASAREDAHMDRLMNKRLSQEEKVYVSITADKVMEIAEYAQQYPEHTEIIVATIRERGEFNMELIDTMLAGEASAVASGVL